MIIRPEWPVLKRGTWLYDGVAPFEVRIVQGDMIYGSGDYEDPPEVREDQDVKCFYVVFDDVGDQTPAVYGVYPTLDEALAGAENAASRTISWRPVI